MPTSVQQQSGRWTGQDAQMTERMDAIRNPGTMAGSPDTDRNRASVSRRLGMVFVFQGAMLS
ncbi:hypothetical protein BLN97_29040 [Bradyrhizobium elkanii]|nr:hypothetical protein BLN97_29040 [Bradyrhizobium elkanii]